MHRQTQRTEESSLAELRQLLQVRAAKQQELNAIDRAIEEAAGINNNDRPKDRRMSGKDLRARCRA